MRTALPRLAESLIDRTDADLEAVPALSELTGRQLIALLHRSRMIRELPCFASIRRHDVKLNDRFGRCSAFCYERDRFTFGRPERAVLLIDARGHLSQAGTIRIDSPDVSHAPVRLPVCFALHEDDLFTVG